MAAQSDTDADHIVREVQSLTRSHRELVALLGDVVDSTSGTCAPDGTWLTYLSPDLLAELRRRTGR